MIIHELIEQIQERFRNGQRRAEIKEDLMNQGYDEDDIDETISKIQKDALKQLPGIAWVYQKIEHFESKPNAGSPKTTALLMVACFIFLIILAGALYFIIDPFGTAPGGRDTKRQSDAIIIQNGLSQYFQKNNHYPDMLDEMVPGTLTLIPHDPKTGKEYSYQPLDNNQNFKLCIDYEEQEQQCLNAAPEVSTIPVVPTDTPVPAFVPQSASSAPSLFPIQ